MLEELENAKDNTIGKIKETAGQISNDQKLELSGKLQSLKADVVKEVDKRKDKIADRADHSIEYAVVSEKLKD
ncbi:MAG: CsbD family protein [Mobilitalea sp.]